MKKVTALLLSILILLFLCSCGNQPETATIAATTLPVYEFTVRLCQGTDIQVLRLVAEDVSCLHDYTLHISQMQAIESAQAVVLSGAELESFLDDALVSANKCIDASENVPLLCALDSDSHAHDHGHEGHYHTHDPHIWLSTDNAKIMAENICNGLAELFPQYNSQFTGNLSGLLVDLSQLEAYASEQLRTLSCREIITFHDGFAYMAEAWDLTVLRAIEEESGGEASAAELIEICRMIEAHQLPAVFTEKSGSTAAAAVIAREMDIGVYSLDMAMSGNSYFEAMYHNIDTLKEALE